MQGLRTYLGAAAGLWVALAAGHAAAHIKWFYPYDIAAPPRAMGEVLQPDFVHLYMLSIGCIYLFFLIERGWYRTGFLADTLSRVNVGEIGAYWIMRGATAFLFGALFVYGMQGDAVYLTPELHTDNEIVPWVHLALALMVWFKPITPVVGLGVLGLYALAIIDYGIYHLLDYMIFLGLGVFFVFGTREDPGWVKLRYVTLFATTGLTIGWGAIEKFAYPQWTYPLLEDQPDLLLGLSPDFFMVLAGFVEFNIAFILLSSASIASRLIALVLNTIFLMAVWMFGMIDAVGHSIIIAVLIVLTVRGPTSARYFLVLSDKSLWTEAYFMTGLYILALNVLFLAYYGLHTLLIGG